MLGSWIIIGSSNDLPLFYFQFDPEKQTSEKLESNHNTTVAYLGHGEKTNYSANPPGRNSQSARAE